MTPLYPTFYPLFINLAGDAPDPAKRGRFTHIIGAPWANAPLPTDPAGTMTLTLTNVVPGSRYDLEVMSTRDIVLSGQAETSTVVLSIPVYLSGDPKNLLRLKVRKASAAPYYRSYETQVTALIGTPPPLFINQLLDE